MNSKQYKILMVILLFTSSLVTFGARKITIVKSLKSSFSVNNSPEKTHIDYLKKENIYTKVLANACDGVAPWDSQQTYSISGNKVTYEGVLYQNKWWTKGDTPGASQWGPWENLGVCEANDLPVVSFVSPANNDQFVLENTSSISIQVNASDTDGTISSVQIEVDGQIFSGTQANWSPTAVGNYIITATATDDKNASATAEITINITSNQPVPPSVFINSPSNGATIEQATLSAVSITATANDSDGTVSSVSIQVDNQTFSGTAAAWTPTAFGNYTITVTAIDNDNLSASATSNVTIQEQSNSGCSYPEYEGFPTIYSQGDIVQYQGDKYEAQVNNLYNVTPGTADHWWLPQGSCVDTNTPPVISTNGNVTVVGVQAIQLSANVTDAEGDALTVSFVAEGTTYNAADNGNGNFTASWTPSAIGTYSININAQDAKGATSSASYDVTVEEIT